MWRAPFSILILLFFIALTCTLQNLAFCWFYIASSWHVVEYSFSVFTLHVAAPYGLLCRCFLIAIFLQNPSSTVFILLAIFTWEIGILLCLAKSSFCYFFQLHVACTLQNHAFAIITLHMPSVLRKSTFASFTFHVGHNLRYHTPSQGLQNRGGHGPPTFLPRKIYCGTRFQLNWILT